MSTLETSQALSMKMLFNVDLSITCHCTRVMRIWHQITYDVYFKGTPLLKCTHWIVCCHTHTTRAIKMDVHETFLMSDHPLCPKVRICYPNVHVHLHPLCGEKCTCVGHEVLNIEPWLSRTLQKSTSTFTSASGCPCPDAYNPTDNSTIYLFLPSDPYQFDINWHYFVKTKK
jgi:hypothetical protein